MTASPQRFVISASRRTDIPAAHTQWLFDRLAAGSCSWRHPFGGQLQHVSLQPEHVIAFVFWSKWYAPFLQRLNQWEHYGIPARFQFTITGYPAPLEPVLTNPDAACRQAHTLADLAGPEHVIWRYDPILLGDPTPADWHRRQFAHLAARLAGASRQVFISFVTLYAKTRRNLAAVTATTGWQWQTPSLQQKLDLTGDLITIAARHGLRVSACCDPELQLAGAMPGACIDADAIRRLVGDPDLKLPPAASRQHCRCCQCRDIGAYDSCPLGCAFCYANATPNTSLPPI